MPGLANLKSDSAGACTARMIAAGAALGFAPPAAGEIPEARAMAAKLMDHDVASLETFEAVLAFQPASILVLREEGEIRGVVATLLMREAARPVVVAGAFDGMDFDLALLSRPDDTAACYYAWGIAGSTKTASSAVMALCRALRYDALADINAYAYAATAVGRHVGTTYLGFQPIRRPDDNLLCSPAVLKERAA